MSRPRNAVPLLALAALIAAGEGSAPRADGAPPGPFRFQDLSAVSGGPIDFGTPTSTVEKATGAFVDVDGDGWDDIVTLTGIDEPCGYFLNRPDGFGGRTMVPAPAGNGLDDGAAYERDGAAICAGDVDADGDVDLYIGCGFNDPAELGCQFDVCSPITPIPAGRGNNILLLNDGTGRFTDATTAAGLDGGDNTTCGATFLDIDLDGDLDLLSCNTDFARAGKAGDGVAHLYRNELRETGVLRFVDETAARGIFETGIAVWAVSGLDYDSDGDFDILICHDIGGPTQLFRNDGTGHFADVTASSGSGAGDDRTPSNFGNDSYSAMGIAWGDVENDGDFDLYISDVAGDPAVNVEGNAYYVNNGDGTFALRARSAGVLAGWVTWGTTFADFDLDGFVDLYVGGGDLWDQNRSVVRSWIYRNDGDGTFTDAWTGSGMRHDAPLHRENGSSSADIDGDGRPDLLVVRAERSGASPYVYLNVSETFDRRWLGVTLRGDGVRSNTSAVGARVRVTPKDAAGQPIAGLTQLREVQSADSRNAVSSFTQHVGLGADAVLADVEVRWPRAGTTEERTAVYRDVPLDRRVTIPEAPRVPDWRPDPEHALDIPDRAVHEISCVGQGEPDPLTTLAVEIGPSWVTRGPWRDGPTILLDAPRVDEIESHAATLLAVAQGAADPEARQTLRLRVVPAPTLTRAKLLSKRELRLDGDHLDLAGLAVTIDGTPCVVRTAKALKPQGGKPRSKALVVVPKALRRSLSSGRHEVRVVEPEAGFAATATISR